MTELIPGLPEELALECLTRLLPSSTQQAASEVCRRWRDLIQSRELYRLRKQDGLTRKVACLIQALPNPVPTSGSDPKPGGSVIYGIVLFDYLNLTWEPVDPHPKYPNGLPLFCQITSCEGMIVVIGGWDPVSYDPVTDTFLYDFATRKWKKCKDMPAKRSFFAMAGSENGKVIVAGGHDESKDALSSAWEYDLKLDKWTQLPEMSQGRDECEGVMMVGPDEFWVVSGYGTESQGEFESSADVFNIGSGDWRRVERVWETGKCPRASVRIGTDGKVRNWADLGREVSVGPCGVLLGEGKVIVCGSEYQGGAHGLYLVEGHNGKLEKVKDVPEEFSGFVQSGCCVEI